MITKLCPSCGSDNMIIDAAARWSVPDQKWELTTTHDIVTCDDCGDETYDPIDKLIPPIE